MKRFTQLIGSRGGVLLLAGLLVALGVHPLFAAPLVMGNTLAALDQALQITYAEPVVNQIIQDSDWLDMIESDSNVQEDEMGAKYVETSHYMRIGGSVGSRLEDEYLVESLPASFINSRIYLKKITATIDMTGDVMRRMKRGQGSWVDYADRAMTDLAERTRDHMDRIALLYGYGVRAQLNGTPTLVSTGIYDITLKNWGGIAGATNPWLLFNENDSLNFASSLTAPITPLSSGGVYKAVVENVDEDNNKIRVSMPSGLAGALADGYYIAEGDNRGTSFPSGSTPTERDFMGLFGHVDTGSFISTYFNVARATYRRFQCIDINAATQGSANSQFTEETIDFGDTVASQRARAAGNLLLCSSQSNTQYWKSLKGDRNLPDPRQYVGGKPRGLKIMLGDRVAELRIPRKLCPEYAFLIQTDQFRFFSNGPMTWDDTTGSLWNRVVDSTGPKDKFYATAFFYRQLWCSFVRKQVRFKNLVA